ncbi:MAG: transglutaminase family protein [Candidatus Eremiobacteraeota bacterium]|nr:transglutaminase family protein [Candidatus Eremiobacteraeota bacterium]
MRRRSFIQQGAALTTMLGVPRVVRATADNAFAPKPDAWRTFEVTTRVEVASGGAAAKAWIPIPSFTAADWIRVDDNTWNTTGDVVEVKRDPRWGVQMLHVDWRAGTATIITMRSRVTTRDRSTDFTSSQSAPALSAAERALYTSATEFLPTDGIVRERAQSIVSGSTTEVEKARRIYEWVVDNTFRRASTRGCGLGDIRFMVETGDFGGKCADINGLYVALARASGLPARDLYGIRVAPSRFGYASLGAKTSDITKAQHCRAEVFLDRFGWVPVDPADVRKVALEEPPGNLSMNDPHVVAARKTLFGAWETNWIAYNSGHDIRLPDSTGDPLPFLMYPQAEVAGVRSDSLDAATFKYAIHSRELSTSS